MPLTALWKLRRAFPFSILFDRPEWGRIWALIIACVNPLQKPGDGVFVPVFPNDFLLDAVFPVPFDQSFQDLRLGQDAGMGKKSLAA